MALGTPAEDVPAKSRGDGESVAGMIGVFDKGCVIWVSLGDEEILGEVIAFTARRRSHTREERGEVAASNRISRARGLICSGDVESVRAGRRRWLAHVQESFHILRASGDFVLAPDFRDGSIDIAVLAGKNEGIPVRGAADAASRVPEIHVGKSLVHLIGGGWSGKSQSREVVHLALAKIATLMLIVPSEGVTQLQYGGLIDGVVVRQQGIAPVGNVLGIIQIPRIVEGVDTRSEKPIKGETAEDALLLAFVVIHANVKPLRGCGVHARDIQVVEGPVRG